jgi:hypothetical protein
VKLSPELVPLDSGQHLANLVLDEFMPVKSHLALELDLSIGGETRRLDLLVELDRTGRLSSNVEKFRAMTPSSTAGPYRTRGSGRWGAAGRCLCRGIRPRCSA